jgi:hypothetical protein
MRHDLRRDGLPEVSPFHTSWQSLPVNTLSSIILIGIGATAITDIWGFARKPLLGVPSPDYGLVGRWFGHMLRGQFFHASIAAAAPVHGERVGGWVAHYLIGIAYAALLVAIGGSEWLQNPTPWLALAVGVGSVVAPFLVMQPAMGAGVAARRMAHPGSARLHSLLMHAAFGIGLFVSGWALR